MACWDGIEGWNDWAGGFGVASNIVVGTNPPYAISDFFAVYPKFASIQTLPAAVLNAYITLASASLSQARWGAAMWPIAMGWFVSHYVTLYLRSDGDAQYTSAGSAAAAGLTRGILVSKSAGGVSAGIQQAGGLESWGSWPLTEYGVQLATNAKIIGGGPMLVY